MAANLLFGTLLIAATVLLHTIGLIALSRFMTHLVRWFSLHRHGAGKSAAMVATVLALFALHTVEIWTWASAFVALRAVRPFEDALYVSVTTFSTLGGTIAVSPQWRLLVSLEAITGFLLIGWSIAYLVTASTRFGPFRRGEHF